MNVSMIEVLIHVNDVEACRDFWVEKVGYGIAEKTEAPWDSDAYVLRRDVSDNVSLVLVDRNAVLAIDPAANVAIPYIVFTVDGLVATHGELKRNGVQVSDIMDMGGIKTFDLIDCEGNRFAVV